MKLDMELGEGLGSDEGRRAQGEADRLQPALQRGEVHRDGGKVTLRAQRVPRADVGKLAGVWPAAGFPLPTTTFAEFLEISVTDGGIGISPEGLEPLFKPFSQIDSGLARKFEGTGLGLAMVKLLAELHGGTVAVESAVGEGSRFTVWLPMRAPDGRRRPRWRSRRCRSPLQVGNAQPGSDAHRAGGGERLSIGRADSRAARGGGLHRAARRLAPRKRSRSRCSSRWR